MVMKREYRRGKLNGTLNCANPGGEGCARYGQGRSKELEENEVEENKGGRQH